MNALLALTRREWLRYWRRRMDAWQAPLVFVIVCTLFPLGGLVSPQALSAAAPAILWAAALVACVFGLETLYREELANGWVDEARLGQWPVAVLVALKNLVHWLFTGLPVVLLTWPMGAALYLEPGDRLPIMLSLLLGTPTLVWFGSIAAALTAGMSRGGLLTGLLMLPLYIPILIFGAGVGVAAQDGLPVTAQLYLLASLLTAALVFAPLATAAALKIASD